MNITIRRAEPNDAEALNYIYAGPKAIWGTLQLPYPGKLVGLSANILE
jgi:hypothetical protein